MKLAALLLVALLLTPVIAMAQQEVATTKALVARPAIRTLIALSKGFAVSKQDPTDFEIMKLGMAKVTIIVLDKKKVVSLGVLQFGDSKYKVKNVTLANDTVVADVYNGTEVVGELAITRVVKSKETVWVGELKLNEKEYNVYLLEAIRKFRPLEIKERVAEFCKEHPQECRNYAKELFQKVCQGKTEGCAKKISEYCKEHLTERGCLTLKRVYCANHPEDLRCKEELKEYCANHPEEKYCHKFCEIHPLVCGWKQKVEEKRAKIREMIARGLVKAKKLRELIKHRHHMPAVPPLPPEANVSEETTNSTGVNVSVGVSVSSRMGMGGNR